jgi:hypothetical protein
MNAKTSSSWGRAMGVLAAGAGLTAFPVTATGGDCLRVRVMQESQPGAGDFLLHVLGEIEPFQTVATGGEFYGYDEAFPLSFGGPVETEPNRAQLFILEAAEGLAVGLVLDHAGRGNADGGRAELNVHLFGDEDGAAAVVEDDAAELLIGGAESGCAGATYFAGIWTWAAAETDGLLICGLETGSKAHLNFGELDGDVRTAPIGGLISLAALGGDGALIELALEPYRRVRLDLVRGNPACPGDLDCSGVVDGADLGHLLAEWGECPQCAGDLDGNEAVTGADLGLLLGAWGVCR